MPIRSKSQGTLGSESQASQSIIGERSLLIEEDTAVVSYYSRSIDIRTREEEEEDWTRRWSDDEDDDISGDLPLDQVTKTIHALLIYEPLPEPLGPLLPVHPMHRRKPSRRGFFRAWSSHTIASTSGHTNTRFPRDVSQAFSLSPSLAMAKAAEAARETQSAQCIWEVAHRASMCAVLAMLGENKPGMEKDAIEGLALAVLTYGLSQRPATQSEIVFLQQILLRPWFKRRSVIQWAIEYNCQSVLGESCVLATLETLWQTGPDWRSDREHPSYLWSTLHYTPPWPSTMAHYLARWPNHKYQTLVAVISGLVYIGLHCSVIANKDYTNYRPYPYEYVYYEWVISDLLLELYTTLCHPILHLQKSSSWFSLVTTSLLLSAFITRIVGLSLHGLINKAYYLQTSYSLLACATPLLFCRLLLWTDTACWSITRLKILMHRCVSGSASVLGLAAGVILAFWICISALQKDDMSAWKVLYYLALGAVHAPEVADTIAYQPALVGSLLFLYLFLMSVVITGMVTASFLSVLLQVTAEIDSLQRISSATRVLEPPALRAHLPNAAIEIVFALIQRLLGAGGYKKHSYPRRSLDITRQLCWYLVFSPIILSVGIVEYFVYLSS
ncbi:hypothetical protein BDF14DRAFT_1840779 [Spinellus fusiger]|nr:hypothetical protein BDF14DRAFT_1840779 [Spinellus fusiger]